jgi:hypothetical protein
MAAAESFIVERRARPRLRISSAARLRPNDWSATQVDMLDISEHGFRASGEILFRIGLYVSLQVPGIGWVEAQIVWQHLDQFGARFVMPIDLAHCGWTERVGPPARASMLGRQLAGRVLRDEPRAEAG